MNISMEFNERQIEVSATICPAERNVGIMSAYLDDLVITDAETGEEVEVTEREREWIVDKFFQYARY